MGPGQIDNAQCATLPNGHPGKLSELHVRSTYLWLIGLAPVMLGAVIGCALAFGLLAAINPILSIVTLVLVLVLARRAILRIWQDNVYKRVSDVLLRHEGASVDELLSKIFARERPGIPTYMDSVVRAFTAHGRAGVTIRSCAPKFAPHIDPIDVTFEARPLDEADASVAELFGDPLVSGVDPGLGGSRACDAERTDPIRQRLNRNIRLVGWPTLVYAVSAIAFGVLAYSSGVVSFWLVVSCLLLARALFGFGRARSARGRRQWFVVPSGLVIRETSFDRSRWTLRLFDRQTSALVVHRLGGNQWMVTVANVKLHRHCIVTAYEAVVVLRSWLSPIPTPSLEQLTDLAQP